MLSKITCLAGLSLFFLLTGCKKQDASFYDGMGKRPVYLATSDWQQVGNAAPQPIQQSGTIFLLDTLLFIAEPGLGIHVFSFTDSVHTVNLAFFKIPAITDFTVSGTTLYADSWKDLVAIDISNLQQIRETSRTQNVISPPLYPPLYNGFFECVEESRGAVIGWEDADV